jgi:predicted membrane-bound spermidine synthase
MKDIKRYHFYIFIIGFVNAVYQLGLIKELNVAGQPFNFISLTINFIIALTLVSLGIGAYVSRYFQGDSEEKTLKKLFILLGFAILSVLFFILLFLPEQILKASSLSIIFLFISIPMVLMGIIVGLIYLPFIRGKNPGKIVFFHILGFGLGQIIGIIFTSFLGVNSLFFLMFFLIFLAIREKKGERIIIIAVFLLLIFVFSLEARLESIRQKEKTLWPSTKNSIHVFSGWSPYSKIDFYQYDTDCIAGLYNYRQQWMTCKDKSKDFKLRQLLYPELKGDILVIGTGGGISLNSFEDGANVTALEIDPLVVNLMKGEFRDYNDNAYNKIESYAKDGRAFLDSSQKKYDYIIFEGADYTPFSPIKNFIKVDNYLYTKEGLSSAISSLKENGILLIFLSNSPITLSKTINSFSPDVFFELRKFYLYSPIEYQGFLLTATKNQGAVNNLSSFLDSQPDYFKRYEDSLPFAKEITDQKPFLYLPEKINLNFYFFIFIFLISIITLFSLLNKKNSYLYFFLLGVGMMIGELFYINIFRSLYSDYIGTFVVISIIFFTGFSLGAYFHEKLKNYIVLTPFLQLASLFVLGFIPWSSNIFIKLLFSIFCTFPASLLMGVFFPFALSLIKEKKFPLAYLLDSLGSFFGFFIFYVSSILFGFNFSFYLVLIIYALLVVLISLFR